MIWEVPELITKKSVHPHDKVRRVLLGDTGSILSWQEEAAVQAWEAIGEERLQGEDDGDRERWRAQGAIGGRHHIISQGC